MLTTYQYFQKPASYMEISISIKTKPFIKKDLVFKNKCKTNPQIGVEHFF